MGRAPCCDKANVKKGPWSPEEDYKLREYIEKFGFGGNWIALPQKAGLRRCGKSCRLRWLNYLRPNIKHGNFSDDEDRIICSLFASIGSRWSIIASHLPGRTDNDIKNYWNTKLKKKLFGISASQRKPNQQQKQKQYQILIPSLDLTPTPPASFLSHQHSFIPSIFPTCTSLPPLPMWQSQNSSKLLSFGGYQNNCSSSEISFGKEILEFESENYSLFGTVELGGADALRSYGYEEIKHVINPDSGCNSFCFDDPSRTIEARGSSFNTQERVMYYNGNATRP